ncbi:MAG: DNA polymerase III subunit delta [Pseudomonadota bacterium]
MKVSGASAEGFLKKPDPKIWCALIFCEDDGVASDAAGSLISAWSQGQPVERLVITEDDLSKSPATFFDTMEARSLLGDQRIAAIRLTSEKQSRHLVQAIEMGEGAPGRFETRLIITAGSLKKTSKLRKTAEAAQFSAAIQLFEDSEADVETRVRGALSDENITIEDDAIGVLLAALPNDRRLVRSEVEKLALFGRGLGRAITADDIRAISASGVDVAQQVLVTAALKGDARSALAELERLEAAGTSPISILRGLQRETEKLIAAHAQGVSDANSAMRLRPPVWRDQWPDFRAAMRTWNPAMLMRLLARIHECESDAKLSGTMAGATTRHLVMDILRLAAVAAAR